MEGNVCVCKGNPQFKSIALIVLKFGTWVILYPRMYTLKPIFLITVHTRTCWLTKNKYLLVCVGLPLITEYKIVINYYYFI